MNAETESSDDSFSLYDLRVEVVCPPGKRIMCGAKEGDHFTLEGEMLYLPPAQGISIYSLGTKDVSWTYNASKMLTTGQLLCFRC
jgi:hypothetical protein